MNHPLLSMRSRLFEGHRPTALHRRRLNIAAAPRCDIRQAKGRRFEEDNVKVGSAVGEGSFGQVFQGSLDGFSGGERRVILKRVKDRVSGAQEMAEMEHLLNVHASAACKRSVAPFLGYLEVEEQRGRLTRGLWLVWEYEGDRTLAYYLRRRDCIAALATDLGIDESAVVPTVMQQIFQCLLDLHSAGLVHRDVKPANIVFCEAERRFKLIDLGAAADLRTGTNYKPAETILDPSYCPPEEYILPTDSPNLRTQIAPVALAMSPVLWNQNRPDCFDSYSAGVVLLQLGLPFLRSSQSLKNWKATFARCDYDIDEWRARSSLSAKQTALLDADDGLGWDLAAGLLRPREVETDSKGFVKFVNTGKAPRLTPAAAMKHPYIKNGAAAGKQSSGGGKIGLSFGSLFGSSDIEQSDAEEHAVASSSSSAAASSKNRGTGSSGSASGSSSHVGSKSGSSGKSTGKSRGASILDSGAAPSSSSTPSRASSSWSWMKNKLFDLEARIADQASDTQTQTGIVLKLREDVSAGRASPSDLEREESTLKSMKGALQGSVKELNGAYSAAKGFLSSMLGRSGSRAEKNKSTEAERAAEAAAAAAAAAEAAAQAAQAAAAAAAAEKQAVVGKAGKAVSDAATNAIYSGLKFTGMALNAVADLAAGVERGITRAQEEAAAQRAATLKLVDILQNMDPPVTGNSTWEETAPLITASADIAVLSERQKKQAFNAYVDALRRAQRAAAERAMTFFRDLLDEAAEKLDNGASYEEFCAVAGSDARFTAVADEADRKATFQSFMAGRQAAAEAAAEAAAISEAAKVKASEEAAALVAQASAAAVGEKPSIEQMQSLETLRAEQARLKEEYERMEEKLRSMEQQLRVQNLVGALLDDGGPIVESEPDGSVVFKFAAAPPGVGKGGAAAGVDLKKTPGSREDSGKGGSGVKAAAGTPSQDY